MSPVFSTRIEKLAVSPDRSVCSAGDFVTVSVGLTRSTSAVSEAETTLPAGSSAETSTWLVKSAVTGSEVQVYDVDSPTRRESGPASHTGASASVMTTLERSVAPVLVAVMVKSTVPPAPTIW